MPSKQKTPRAKIHEITADNDIRYRGPITYQHFQILGWLCIVVSQIALLLRIGSKLDASIAESFGSIEPLLKSISNMSLPLLLFANFAQILDSSDGYKNQLIKNACASLGVFVSSLFFFYRYIVGALAAVSTDPAEAGPVLEALLQTLSPTGFISFNLFIDLFLCTLVMFFLNYQPQRFFRGKLVHVFRLFTLLPIGYEIACMVLKVLSARGVVRLPLWTFPLLTVKPPMTFLLFIILAFFVKVRELRFRRHGKTHAEYQEFLKTNKNSWNFSVFLAIMIVVVSVLDFAVMTGYSVFGAVERMSLTEVYHNAEALPTPDGEKMPEGSPPLEVRTSEQLTLSVRDAEAEKYRLFLSELAEDESAKELLALLEEMSGEQFNLPSAEPTPEPLTEEERAQREREHLKKALETALTKEMITANALGFGGSISMLLLAPLVLLFSYTKAPRSEKVGLFIPAVGVVLIVFLYLEGARLMLWNLPIPKMNMSELSENILLLQLFLR